MRALPPFATRAPSPSTKEALAEFSTQAKPEFIERVVHPWVILGIFPLALVHRDEVSREKKMLPSGTDPEFNTNEYILVYEDCSRIGARAAPRRVRCS